MQPCGEMSVCFTGHTLSIGIESLQGFNPLKDKSGVGIILDYSREYTVVNGVLYFFSFVSLSICDNFSLVRSTK